ncbi:MAG: TIGR02281 family clan AA aspartic protease [Blastomonas sp.]
MVDDSLRLIYAVLLLVLVGSALISRAIPMRDMFRMAITWVGIFALIVLIMSFRSEMGQVWTRLKAEIGFGGQIELAGKVMQLRKQNDGHFYARGTINGDSVEFLIDSGATTSAVTFETMEAAGIKVDQSAFPVMVDTANGTVQAWRAVIPEVQIGGIVIRNLPVIVSESFGDTNMLGMNFLSALKSWDVEGDVMRLVPPQ